MNLSRREFLRLSGLALGAAFLPPLPPDEAPRRAEQLGRTIYANYIYDRPSFNARQIGMIGAESVISLFATVESEDNHYNRTWYQVQRGYMHSASIQPVRWVVQTPVRRVPETGFLGEVTVPFTLAKAGPHTSYATNFRAYYSTTYWVVGVQGGDDDYDWYKTLDDLTREYNWIRADHVRRVDPSELTPLSPQVTHKRIEVELETQWVRFFEDDRLVREALSATGPYMRTENGQRIFSTPSGDWRVNKKRPSRHMAGDDLAAADFYDLPGVPWVSYFHWWGVSFHGTYWHNDYGRPRSHGCVNLPSETAKWLYRWTLPQGELVEVLEGEGTQVLVY